jgi:hypothetical protein
MGRSNLEHHAIIKSMLAGDEAERLMTVRVHNVEEELVRLLVNIVPASVEEDI